MVICRARLPADIPPILLQVTCDLPVLTAFVTLPRQSLWGCCGNVSYRWSRSSAGEVFNGKPVVSTDKDRFYLKMKLFSLLVSVNVI